MEAITREEKIISGENLTPITRKEMFLAKAAGQDIETPTPITREEYFLSKITGGGGSVSPISGATLILAEHQLRANQTTTIADISELNLTIRGKGSTYPEAFWQCDNLLSVSLPQITEISERTFCSCHNLYKVDVPNVEMIQRLAFEGCISLTEIDISSARTLQEGAFGFCSALKTVKLSQDVETIPPSMFSECTSLQEIDLTRIVKFERGALSYCTSLIVNELPSAKTIREQAFTGCTSITSIDLPKATSISGGAFYGCFRLDTLILSNTETVCNFAVDAITNTKILTAENMPTGEGFVYVPTALYEQYVAALVVQVMQAGYDEATATYLITAVLRKIEDYPEICGVA